MSGIPSPQDPFPSLAALTQVSAADLRSILDWLSEGIVVTDGRGKLLYWNASAERLLALPRHAGSADFAAITTDMYQLYTMDGLEIPTEERPLFRALRGEPVEPADYRFLRRETDERRILHVSATTMGHGEGKTLGVLRFRDVTEARRMEEELRQSEERARAYFVSISDAVCVHEMTPEGTLGRFLEVNQVFCDWLGYSPAELMSMRPSDLDDPQSGVTAAEITRQLAAGKTVMFEQVHIAKDGSRIPVEIHSRPFKFRGKLAAIAVLRNITQRRKDEEALRASQERLSLAIRAAQLYTFEVRYPEQRFEASAAFREFYELEESGPLTAEQICERVLPEDLPELQQAIAASLQPGGSGLVNNMHRIRRRDGIRWMLVRLETFFEEADNQRQPVRTVGVALDITRQKEAELEIRASRQQLRTALDAARLGIWTHDLDSDVLISDSTSHTIFGLMEDVHINGEALRAMVLPEDRPLLIEERCKAREAADYSGTLNIRIQRPNGSIRWISLWGVRLPGEANGHVVLTGVAQDITDRMRTEMALRSSRQQLRAALDSARLGIWTLDLDSQTLHGDDLTRGIFGFEPEERVTPDMLLERILPEDREHFRLDRDQLIGEGGVDTAMEYRLQRPDGEIRWVNVRRTMLHDASGRPVRLIGVVRDVTEQRLAEQKKRALEQQLLHAQKMEAVGRLAGGVAHDFNNILMVIRSYAEIMQVSMPPEHPMSGSVEGIIQASERAAALTGQMLAFSRKQVAVLSPLSLSASVADAARMLQRLIGEDVELKLNLQSAWMVRADRDQLTQVLMNLTVNARDAMPNGGQLTISTTDTVVEAGTAGQRSVVPPGEYAVLTASDTGCGIAKEVQERMFEPFFTTKSVGKGTGLGLSTVYGIVKQSEGHVLVNSEVDQGATFTIYLPRVAAEEPASGIPSNKRLPRGSETILVVEDEDALRSSIGEFLSGLGYDVLLAASGPEALRLAREVTRPLHLVLTDMVMPKMSGREMVRRLTEQSNGTKTIFMSGYTTDALALHEAETQHIVFLRKPFSLVTLAHKIRDVLGHAAGTD